MKLLTLVPSLALSAATVLPRQYSTPTGQFDLTEFSISGSRMSDYTFYRFTLTDPLTSISTYCVWSTGGAPYLQQFPLVPCKDDPAFEFSWTSVAEPAKGWTLAITTATGGEGANRTAEKFFDISKVKQSHEANPLYDWGWLEAEETQSLTWERK